MELAPPPDALVRPWRRATLVATTVAAIELVLLVVGGIVLLGRHLAHNAAPVAAPATHTAATKPNHAKPALAQPEPVGKPTLARSETSVLVLNGNGRSGAAASEASLVTARGYRLGRVGNAPRADYPTTVVMYRPGYRAEASRLAHDIGVSVFAPLDGMTPSSLGAAQLAVVVGNQ